MRWDSLFDDLESQLELELGAEELDLAAEEERLRLGRLTFRDRLLALLRDGQAPDAVAVTLRDGETLTVRLSAIGRDWVAGDLVGSGTERPAAVIPLAAIAALAPTTAQLAASVRAESASETATALSARLGLTFVLRDLCRRRVAIDLVTGFGRLHGTIDRVGRDHLDLAEHEVGVPRRDSAVVRLRIVPLGAMNLVRF